MEFEVVSSELKTVTQNIWTMMLRLKLAECSEIDKTLDNQEMLISSVDLDGAWHGTISLIASGKLARTMASHFLAGYHSELTDVEIDDVLKELANMTGGNLKNCVPEPTRLHLPRVERLTLNDWRSSHMGTIALELSYQHENEPLIVAVTNVSHGHIENLDDIEGFLNP